MSRRILQGTVISDGADKTVVVRVDRRIQHPLYKKYMKRSKKYMAHDSGNVSKIGDRVEIRECRPVSKNKHWEIIASS